MTTCNLKPDGNCAFVTNKPACEENQFIIAINLVPLTIIRLRAESLWKNCNFLRVRWTRKVIMGHYARNHEKTFN